MAAMAGASMRGAILEPFELEFSDLALLSGSDPCASSLSDRETERLDVLAERVMDALGPSGAGLITITGIPEVSDLRRKILPLARKLSLLDKANRARILKRHNLGSDVPLKNPDRAVSSFAKQLKYSEHSLSQWRSNPLKHEEKKELDDSEFQELGQSFNLLASFMMELGLHFAKLCDRKIGGREFESSLLNSGSAKARLIHYHSRSDHLIIRDHEKGSKVSTMDPKKLNTNVPQELHQETKPLTDFWQHWHYDYGIFTLLTSPMFISNTDERIQSHENSCLQLFDSIKNKIFTVKASPESFILQVGETADILSKGKLRSTLHSVCKPSESGNFSRETFVVFLQPSWDKILYTFDGISSNIAKFGNAGNGASDEISEAIPPLCSRLRDGMTFAEFSKVTTKQYYGAGGTQSGKGRDRLGED